MLKMLVGASLAGQPVRYNDKAKSTRDAWLDRWRVEGRLVTVCPEVTAGFPMRTIPKCESASS
ncbi:hypothetical protein AWB79_01783 [Caballeronia hypogeia]|uniref:Uncharacterized protein n=1 Tax=Caballeronia hypogeia TaxID=1777140 RepID=A0A158A2A0_9BURK|nr:DUF523 domain-containing protein [Caballeronia hypogeia]SAK51766.1 hypothetical protein AWB79_01783 [Caballeronia hypogeia]